MLKKRKYQFKPDYLKEEKPKKNRLLKFFLFTTVFLILAAGIVYLAIFSPIFKINNIFVTGNKDTDTAEIMQISSQILQNKFFNKISKHNLILLPDREISGAILSRYPEIKKVAIKKGLKDHSFTIEIEERKPCAVWCRVIPQEPLAISTSSVSVSSSSAPIRITATSSNQISPEVEKCFFIDEGGFLFKPAPQMSGGLLATVYNEMEENLDVRMTAADSKVVKFILDAKKELSAANLNLTEFIINSKAPGDLEIIAPQGWLIYLNIDNSPASQIWALKQVLEQELKEKRTQLEYVDLRVQNRVYYKLKSQGI